MNINLSSLKLDLDNFADENEIYQISYKYKGLEITLIDEQKITHTQLNIFVTNIENDR